jgi:hypothetical protein
VGGAVGFLARVIMWFVFLGVLAAFLEIGLAGFRLHDGS